jgi:hypothetical protein
MLSAMCRVRLASLPGQSLVEFALSLPAVLTLILLSVRMLLILNAWYMLVNAADIGVRAAALTGSRDTGIQLVLANMPGVASTDLTVTFTPSNTKTFTFPPTPVIMPTNLPGLADPFTIPDAPIRINVVYQFQLVGPLVPQWTVALTASATARLESRLTPLSPLNYF